MEVENTHDLRLGQSLGSGWKVQQHEKNEPFRPRSCHLSWDQAIGVIVGGKSIKRRGRTWDKARKQVCKRERSRSMSLARSSLVGFD